MKKVVRIAANIETNRAHGVKLIGVQAERSRAHGRSLLEGIARFAGTRPGWRMELIEPQRLREASRLSGFDGFIVRIMDDCTAKALAATGKPFVDTYGRSDSVSFPTIRLDDRAIARMAAKFLAGRLFPECGYCGFGGLRFSAERGAAFAEECAALGMACHAYDGGAGGTLSDDFFQNETAGGAPDHRRLAKWIAGLTKPIAVFCCNDLRAYQLAKVCAGIGARIPQDVAILGVDNDVLLCSFSRPPLSSIETDPGGLGFRAGELLAELIDGGGGQDVIRHAPKSVVERASTDIFNFQTPWLSEAVLYIHRNLAAGVNATDVLRHVGKSHTAANKAFHDAFGMPLHKEIARRRLELACRLLRETDLSAAQVAIAAGYQTPQRFSNAFSKAIGEPPQSWRTKADV